MHNLQGNQVEGSYTANLPWFKKKPIPVFIIATYGALLLVQLIAYTWLEGFSHVVDGNISLIQFFAYSLPTITIFTAGLFLLANKRSALFLYIITFMVGVVGIIKMSASVNIMGLHVLPSIKEYALIFGVIIYCLHLRSEGYFKTKGSCLAS